MQKQEEQNTAVRADRLMLAAGDTICLFVVCLCLAIIFFCLFPWFEKGGIWAFLVTVSSMPIAFELWKFRDENKRLEIANTRKDINLKEFQKLAEWVSDEKTSTALRISTIYNLKPFLRNERGEDFCKPALTLLKQAWFSLQEETLAQLSMATSEAERKQSIQRLRQNAESPLGLAISSVLLCDGGKHLKVHCEMLKNTCFAGMSFNEPIWNLDKDIFENADLTNCQFQGAKFRQVDFSKSFLIGCDFQGASLTAVTAKGSHLERVNFALSEMVDTDFSAASFTDVDFSHSEIKRSQFNQASLSAVKFDNAHLARLEMQLKDASDLSFKQCSQLDHINLSGSYLADTVFKKTRIAYLNLSDTHCMRVTFTKCEINASKFINSQIENNSLGVFFECDTYHCEFLPSGIKQQDFINTQQL